MIDMEKFKKIACYSMVLAMTCICTLSCKKEKIVTGDVFSYVAESLSAYAKVPANAADTVLKNVGIILPAKQKAAFPAILAKPVNSDVEITTTINPDPELIKAYDSLYRIKSPPIPAGLFKTLNDRVLVKAGKIQSIDSVKIEIMDVTGLEVGEYNFVIPVELKSTSDKVRLKSELMFIEYKIEVKTVDVALYAPGNLRSYSLFNSDVGLEVVINAKIEIPIPKDILVEVEAVNNQAAIDAYNAANDSDYKPLPSEAYQLSQSNTIIKANKNTSDANLKFKLTDASKIDPYNDYLLMLKVKADGAGNSSKNTVYITMPKQKFDVTNTLSRTGWFVSGEAFSTNTANQVLDNSFKTNWISKVEAGTVKELYLVTDKVQLFKGFCFVPQITYPTGDILEMEILSSIDGKKWDVAGTYKGFPTSGRTSAIMLDTKTIVFKKPVNAWFFRFRITKSTVDYFTGMTELYAIR